MTSCPICSSESDIRVGEASERALLICPACRHVYWREQVTPEELRAYYAAQYSEAHGQREIQETNRSYYRGHAADLARMLGAASPPEIACVVDFGSSFPVFLEEARAAGVPRVVGVDSSSAVREEGERLGFEMWEPDSFLDGFSGKAEIIRFSHVIEHLPDPVSTFGRAVEHLAEGGIVYVTQPIFPVLQARPASLPFQDSVFPEHLHFFNPLSLSRLMEGAGLAIEQFFAFGEQDEVRQLYEAAVDLPFADSALGDGIGHDVPPAAAPLGGRPQFYGRNCAVVARRPARIAKLTAARLRQLTDAAKYDEAVALLDAGDLTAALDPAVAYYAGVCLGSVGREPEAIELLKRAVAGGFAAFWCAYHLGLFETRRGRRAHAAYYLTVALIDKPERDDIYPLLRRLAGGLQLDPRHVARAADGRRGAASGPDGAAVQGEALAAAAHHLALALALDPAHREARAALLDLAPDVTFEVLPKTG